MAQVSRTSLIAAGMTAVLLVAGDSQARQTPAPPAPAQPTVQQVMDEVTRIRAEIDAVRRQYDERLVALEQRLRQLGAGPLTAEPIPEAAPTSAMQIPPQTPPAPTELPPPAVTDQTGRPLPQGGRNIFNPDTSVIGNFVGVAGKNPFAPQPGLQLTEAEVAFQAIVDPYAKADFFLAAGPEGVELEEGFISFTSLPYNLLVKAGKMRAQFGKVNALHTHLMPTADRPLVTGNLVGGEEGLSDSGVSVSRLFDNRLLFLEAIGEVYAGTSEVFESSEPARLAYAGRLRGYRDLTEDRNLDFGLSYAFGPTDTLFLAGEDDQRNKRLVGVDVTYRYRPLRRAIYSRFNLRSELIWSRQELPLDATAKAFGFYGLGEWQFARRWYFGARLDRSGRAFDGSSVDKGGSVFLTFWPSEFSQLRTQYRRTNYAEGVSSNEVLFQLNFSIGAHGAHVF